MWVPPFRITRIRITNVGIIDDLEMNFPSPSATCIYAGNGVGKTTVLECISLLGHLPCFPRFDDQSGFQRSVLSELLRKRQQLPKYYDERFKLAELRNCGATEWANLVRPPYERNFGLVEFEVEDVSRDATCRNRFYMLVHDRMITGDRQPKLTGVLSRGDFDNRSKASTTSPDGHDFDLEEFGLLVYHDNDQTGQTIDELIHKIAMGRTFIVPDAKSGQIHKDVRKEVLARYSYLEPRSVSYVNTDLNDFGRGNDLRESPKDLESSFGNEMFDRLKVERLDDGILKHLMSLSEACDFVLNSTDVDGEKGRVVWPSFDLEVVRVDKDGKFSLTINRRDGLSPNSITFLSAGENEVFFVFLVLLNLTRNTFQGQSILLLDEPDLHIAIGSRSKFFAEIFQICSGSGKTEHRNLQLIACSHSPAFFDTLRAHYRDARKGCILIARQMLSKPDPKSTIPPKTRLISFYDELYLRRMRGRTYHDSLFRKSRHVLTSFIRYHYCRTRDAIPWKGNESAWQSDVSAIFLISSGLVAFFVFLYFGAGKLINDSYEAFDPERNLLWVQLFLSGHTETEYHKYSNGPFYDSIYTMAGILAFTIVARGLRRFGRTAEMSQFKKMVGGRRPPTRK